MADQMMQLFHRRRPRERLVDRLCQTMVQGKRILFVEDDPLLQGFFLTYVTKLFNVEIILASSLAEARRKLESLDFDAIILDYKLYNGTGIDLYREVSERWPLVEVVFVTGHLGDQRDLCERVEEIGPARVYSKDRIGDLAFIEKLLGQFGVQRLESES